MKISVVNQYSVFLVNEPGALKKFARVLSQAGLSMSGVSSDVRYEAAVVKFIVTGPKEPETSRIISGAGYTSIKTEALCLDLSSCDKVQRACEILGKSNINITNIYFTAAENCPVKIIMVVDKLEKAVEVFKAVKDF